MPQVTELVGAKPGLDPRQSDIRVYAANQDSIGQSHGVSGVKQG